MSKEIYTRGIIKEVCIVREEHPQQDPNSFKLPYTSHHAIIETENGDIYQAKLPPNQFTLPETGSHVEIRQNSRQLHAIPLKAKK